MSGGAFLPQQRLCFWPEPQGHGALRAGCARGSWLEECGSWSGAGGSEDCGPALAGTRGKVGFIAALGSYCASSLPLRDRRGSVAPASSCLRMASVMRMMW
jgi:hypothetical protein